MSSDQFHYLELLGAYDQTVKDAVAEFVRFCQALGLTLEPFQRLLISEIFTGRREILTLLPRGNGKTTLMAAFSLWHLLTHPEPTVLVAAAARHQASIFFDEAIKLVNRSPKLTGAGIKIRGRKVRLEPQRSRINVWAVIGGKWARVGKLLVLATDRKGTLHGHIPTFVFIDELHAHANEDTYVALRTSLHKSHAQLVSITTAGYDPKSTLAQQRNDALAYVDKSVHGTLTVARSVTANRTMFEWSLPEDADLTDPVVVKAANPASFVTLEDLAESLSSPADPLEKARLYANVWTRARDSWLPPGAWDECYEPGITIPDGAEVYIGADGGIKDDPSAVAVIWPTSDKRCVVEVKVFNPPGNGEQLRLSVLEDYILSLRDRYSILGVRYDPKYLERSMQRLDEEGLRVQEVPPSDRRMAQATQKLYAAILEGEILHDGDETLSRHVQAASVKSTSYGARLDKNRARDKMDALMAIAIGFTQVDHSESTFKVLWLQ